MRNISHLTQIPELLNGSDAHAIQSALNKVEYGKRELPVSRRIREENNRQLLQDRLADERTMNDIDDPGSESYAVREPDAFEDMTEQALMSSVGSPSFNRKISLDTPEEDLTPRELKAQQTTRKIINGKLMMLGLGALASGSTAAAIKNTQGDDRDAKVIINPVTGAVVGTGIAAGLGELTGDHLTNAPSREMAVNMSKDRKRGSGSGYQRDGAFERNFGKSTTLRSGSMASVVVFMERPLVLVALP